MMSEQTIDTEVKARDFTVTAGAAKRIKFLQEKQDNPALMLRITVSGGGCSGFQYGFSLDTEINDDDFVFEQDGTKVLIDDVSLDYLDQSELDFNEDLMGAMFNITNPNADSACGCGSSFSVKIT